MKNMFDLDGPLMRALSDLNTLVILNVLTALFCIPVITAGASFTAMHYVIMEMFENRGDGVAKEFWKRFKENLRNATPVWLILLAAAVFIYMDCRIIMVGQTGLPRIMLIPLYIGAFIEASIAVYAFPLTSRFVYSTGATLKNSAILAVANFPRTVLMVLYHVIMPYLLFTVSRLLPLFFLVGISFPAYFSALLYMPVIRKMIGEPEPDEDSPDDGPDGEEFME